MTTTNVIRLPVSNPRADAEYWRGRELGVRNRDDIEALLYALQARTLQLVERMGAGESADLCDFKAEVLRKQALMGIERIFNAT